MSKEIIKRLRLLAKVFRVPYQLVKLCFETELTYAHGNVEWALCNLVESFNQD